MPNKLQIEQPIEQKLEKDERKSLKKLIREQVIHALGEPTDLRDVQVKKLWAENYRVNVLVGPNAASIRVAHSYFVVVGNDGKLVTTTPTITKQY